MLHFFDPKVFSDKADKLTQSTTDDDLLLSADAVSDIFGDSLDLESAEDAEERYQQLYEMERLRSRYFINKQSKF